MTILYYTLDDDKNPVPMEPPYDYTSEAFAQIWNDKWRRVASDTIEGWYVSTVFLTIDHNHSGKGPPILWETMIFDHRGGNEDWTDEFTWRYTTYADAQRGHALTCDLVRQRLARGLKLLPEHSSPPE